MGWVGGRREKARRAGVGGPGGVESLSFRSNEPMVAGATGAAATPTARRPAVGSGRAIGAQKFSASAYVTV
jgi:hypothetical protein